MNARPPLYGATATVGSRPLATAFGAVGTPVLHMLDLAQFLPISPAAWTDAMISETRRHLAGCLVAIEADLRRELAATDLASAMSGIDDTSVWNGVQDHPQLISGNLLAHMRLRAAVGLVGRQAGVATESPAAPVGEDLGWLHEDADTAIARQASALALAEHRWTSPGGEGIAMRPDLPAEHFADLAWTVGALTGVALGRTGQASAEARMAAVTDATLNIIARHDEGDTPVARAALIARLVRGRPDEPRLLGQALASRRILLFAAFAGERAGISTEAVLHALVHAAPRRLAGLCHALGGSASDYRHLLIQLKPVRAGLHDAAIVSLTSDYDETGRMEAEPATVALRGPADLRAKLALVDPTSCA